MFKASRNLLLPAGRLKGTCTGEIFNFQSENAILLGKVPTSDSRIELYLAQARNFLVERLSSKLADIICFRPEDSILFA